jgi:hypothetical protein
MISLVLGVGMSSSAVGRHCSTSRSGRRWLVMSLRISVSSATNDWNRCGCEAAMAREEDCGKHSKIGGEMAAEEGVIGVPTRSPFKGGFGKKHIMAREVTP